jgi:hypothetical protein
LIDGTVKPIDDHWWDSHFSPNGWGCRCEAIQDVTSPVTEKTHKIHIPPIFQTNLAQQGLIFPKNHPYYKGIPQAKLRKTIAYLPPEDTYVTYNINDK